ncbi:hypothetical protein NP493_2598g00000 [Ridgeia piscesae]|uniref:Uncharacterized protein n=1 Tax=Ridgeia piscesae TaxID=27915 RepID=A0AAD9JFC8_RIDPI|nr:hypothetical protein NP493_2598g00000 [Ridgeia piscesae]
MAGDDNRTCAGPYSAGQLSLGRCASCASPRHQGSQWRHLAVAPMRHLSYSPHSVSFHRGGSQQTTVLWMLLWRPYHHHCCCQPELTASSNRGCRVGDTYSHAPTAHFSVPLTGTSLWVDCHVTALLPH